MKILVLSNLYPPYHIGGYELNCYEVVNELRKRKHSVFILTSTHNIKKSHEVTDNVFRQLLIYRYEPTRNLSSSKLKLIYTEWHNNRALRNLIQSIVPDIIFIWNMQGLSMSLLITAKRSGIPLMFSLGDTWLIDAPKGDEWFNLWNYIPENSVKGMMKKFLQSGPWRAIVDRYMPTSPEDLSLSNLYFISEDLKQRYIKAGVNLNISSVIYWGVNTDTFIFKERELKAPNKLLFCGRIIQEKGVHLAIEAIGHLIKKGHTNLVLDIAGNSDSGEYKQYLKDLADKKKIESYVNFIGKFRREQMPEVYSSHDIFLFTSIWQEPLGLTILEAMSCGCVVVGAEVGGSKEILRNGENCLTFEPNNAIDLAEKIEKLIKSPQLWFKLREGGRRTVVENFNVETMIDKIESHLNKIIADHSRDKI